MLKCIIWELVVMSAYGGIIYYLTHRLRNEETILYKALLWLYAVLLGLLFIVITATILHQPCK